MESEFSPDKDIHIPPVPLKTYQWEDLRRARESGGYPWTHLLKPPLEGEITAEDIIRETTPRRSMSREMSRSRTHSPADFDGQKILNLDSSPGSSRRHGEEGEDEGVHIPNFSKEVSLDSDDEPTKKSIAASVVKGPISSSASQLGAATEIPKNISPKGILKRRIQEQEYVPVTETRDKTKCCHPLVNKIKHLADKTLQKLDKNESEKSPISKRKKNENFQEIRQLKSSPGAVRRQKYSAIKLGDSDEMSKTMSIDATPPTRKKKEHVYEDIEESKTNESNKNLQSEKDVTLKNTEENKSNSIKEVESLIEKKSVTSQDPSLVTDNVDDLRLEESIMQKLHKKENINKEALVLDMDSEEPNVDEVFQNQLDELEDRRESPNITITEIFDDETTSAVPLTNEDKRPSTYPQPINEPHNIAVNNKDWSKICSKLRRWTSDGGTPIERPIRPTREGSVQSCTPEVRCACQFFQSDALLPERLNPVGTRPTSQCSNFISNESDHEYEIIGKPPPNITYTSPSVNDKPLVKADDELSSTTSLERKYLQHASDEEEQFEEEEKHGVLTNIEGNVLSAETLQKDIEERYFISTPSTVSRTECDVSTSQVESSALENLPLKRDSRQKFSEQAESNLQKRIKEGTGKLKNQANKLKSKLQNIKNKQFSTPDKPRTHLPEKPKFKMPQRPKISFPDRPKFSFPERRKTNLSERPKSKKISMSEKFSLRERKFSFPSRPKFNVPDLSKFKLPERPKINFSSLRRKKETRMDTESTESTPDLTNKTTAEFEVKTYPRLFSKKKKQKPLTSSSPTLNRDDTPPPTFTFTRVRDIKKLDLAHKDEIIDQPREYGNFGSVSSFENDRHETQRFETTYDFDNVDDDDFACENNQNDNTCDEPTAVSVSDLSPSKQEYTHVINEINNDEFFVRPKGISHENIQVREYLSDEIRQAFNIPKNALTLMGSDSIDKEEHMYVNDEVELDPELLDENEMRYSNEDLNDRDDGYYTFPPVRPSRAKRKKKELDSVQYIDDGVDTNNKFNDVDLATTDDQVGLEEQPISDEPPLNYNGSLETAGYIDDEVPENNDCKSEVLDFLIQSQTLPTPPKRKKKKQVAHTSFTDLKELSGVNGWSDCRERTDDIIVYRTEHEYVVPDTVQETVNKAAEQSPVPPQRVRNRSRSSRCTSLCDDDRTSHGAESLTLDTNFAQHEELDFSRVVRQDSPGYATVDKYASSKTARRSKSKTPPVRRRKSHSSERKYYTVGPTKEERPNRPPRKKSSTSLVTLNSLLKQSASNDITQYVEIEEPQLEEVQNKLKCGEVVSKMKDRPLPPPPRPPRGPKRKKNFDGSENFKEEFCSDENLCASPEIQKDSNISAQSIQEIEVSTQTDPLPDDVDFELGMDENFDASISSSLRDIGDEESMTAKSPAKLIERSRISRTTSRSEKSLKLSDPKISELSKSPIGRTSPTVILVEKRVSSPTRINERDEIVTEASLTVQHIDIDESEMPDVPPLPKSRGSGGVSQTFQNVSNDRALERINDSIRDIQLDNLITQRLQVRDLDVGRLNVNELQASKISVSDIEGMTLQVNELDSKSGHLSVSGIEFSQSVIDEIVKKFAELAPSNIAHHTEAIIEQPRPISREEETQTETPILDPQGDTQKEKECYIETGEQSPSPPMPPPRPQVEESASPPQRPPPPDLTPLIYSYLQDISISSTPLYQLRTPRERIFAEHGEPQHQTPPPPARRAKRKPAPQTESSSEESRPRPSPRRVPQSIKIHEPTVAEAGAQFFRVCQNSIVRTIRSMFNSLMSYISGTEDKKDVQMALVIFLVLVAGLIMFGLSDSRTIHHHHWEFFNPPDGKP